MEKRILTGSVALFFVIAACFVAISFIFPDRPGVFGFFSEDLDDTKNPWESMELIEIQTGDLQDSQGVAHDMRLEIPKHSDYEDVLLNKDIVGQRIDIRINGTDGRYMYECPIVGNGEGFEQVFYSYEFGLSEITLKTDGVKDYKRFDEGRYVYLDFLNPGEKYDRIVVIDAGAGGEDFGHQAQGVLEKDINLQILLKLKALFDEYPDEKIGLFYTRTKDVGYSLDERANFANNIGCDFFLSIQMNSTSSGRVSPINGTEVKYYSQREASKDFASKLSKALVSELGSGDRGILAGDDNLILRKVNATAVICEVGFMSNKEELKLLEDDDYQAKVAEAIFSTLVESLNEDSYSNGE